MSSILKFNEGVRAAVITAVKMGVSLEAAATTAGVDRSTLWRWLRQGADDEARAIFHLRSMPRPFDLPSLMDL